MEANAKRALRDGQPYDRYFPAPVGEDLLRKDSADTQDTIQLIRRVVKLHHGQTARIARLLKASNLEKTCQHIWEFVYHHIQYTKDARGREQIRRPARTWADRQHGVDCDCYSVFIASILTSLRIPHVLRVTKYRGDWQHIYPVVPKDGDTGRFITNGPDPKRSSYWALDCVVDQFDYEVPYRQKHDFQIMQLEELAGIDCPEPPATGQLPARTLGNPAPVPVTLTLIPTNPVIVRTVPGPNNTTLGYDAQGNEYVSFDGLGELGKTWFGKVISSVGSAAKTVVNSAVKVVKTGVDAAFSVANMIPGVKYIADKVGAPLVKLVNRYLNPATILLRNGWLLAMKINLFHVAQKLRYAYYPYAQVSRVIKITEQEHRDLTDVLEKLKRTYTVFGGLESNLKKGILNGKGNGDGKVPKDGAPVTEANDAQELALVRNIENHGLSGLEDFYLDGLGELGEPVSAATIAAVSGAVASLAATLTGILKGEKPAQPVPTGNADVDKAQQTAYQVALQAYQVSSTAANVSKTVQALTPSPPKPVVTPAVISASQAVAPGQPFQVDNQTYAKAPDGTITPYGAASQQWYQNGWLWGGLATAGVATAALYLRRAKQPKANTTALSGVPRKKKATTRPKPRRRATGGFSGIDF